MHHAIPLLQLQEKIAKACLMQRSRGVWSRICGVLSTVLWDCCKPMNRCRDRAFSNSGLEVGLPAFQLPMFAKCDCRKEICSTYLFKASIPATPFGNSNHKLPTRSRFLRAAARSSTSALWLHHAHGLQDLLQ